MNRTFCFPLRSIQGIPHSVLLFHSQRLTSNDLRLALCHQQVVLVVSLLMMVDLIVRVIEVIITFNYIAVIAHTRFLPYTNKFAQSRCQLENNQCFYDRQHKCSEFWKMGCKAFTHRSKQTYPQAHVISPTKNESPIESKLTQLSENL